MTDFAILDQQVTAAAQAAFDKSNPFELQMKLHYMANSDIRGLLQFTESKTFAEDFSHFRIVGVCMLKYYYDRFSAAEDGVEWEDADGEADFKTDEEFVKGQAYWNEIVRDNSAPTYPYREFESENGHLQTILERRPRFFSRDALTK